MPAPVNPPVQPQNRADRAQESREETSRIESWSDPDTLPMPNPRNGFAFRYIRYKTLGEVDPRNWSKRTREGWVPVQASEYPELNLGFANESKDGHVEIGGLILCAMSAKRKAKRQEALAEETRTQVHGVDRQMMREEDSRMPMFTDRRSEVSFGRGS